jgi:hypothetical protein
MLDRPDGGRTLIGVLLHRQRVQHDFIAGTVVIQDRARSRCPC